MTDSSEVRSESFLKENPEPLAKRDFEESLGKGPRPIALIPANRRRSESRSLSSIKQRKVARNRPKHNIRQYFDEDVLVDHEKEEERGQDDAAAERYRDIYRDTKRHFENFIKRDATEIARQFVDRERVERETRRTASHQVPSLKDPKLFAVRCLIGCEREMALSVGNKFRALRGSAEEVRVISVSALDKVQGYIYVEAINKFDAEQACKGFTKLRTQYINVG